MYEELKEHVECGANFLIAPTYLFDSFEDKVSAQKKTEAVFEKGAFVSNGVMPLKEGMIYSGGELCFDDYYDKIKSEISYLYKNSPGAALFLLDFCTLSEAKCAVYAAKEVMDLPICVLLNFKGKSTLEDGFDPQSAVITLQSLGISALGIMAEDCDAVLDILLDMKEFASVPLFAMPDTNSSFKPHEFSQYASDYVANKCVMFGAGKGATPAHTAQIAKELYFLSPFMPDFPTVNAACGKSGICFLDFENRPIGKNRKIIEIDLNSLTDIDEADMVIEKLIEAGTPPVLFNCDEIDVVERVVKLYPGRAAVKSDEYGEITAKEYGALVLSNTKAEN